MTKSVTITKAPAGSPKKYIATFKDRSNGRVKHVGFGAKGYSDYTMHKDAARKQRYLDRHRRHESWSNCESAGSLSRWVLWNKTSLRASISDYKRRCHLK